jgi:hypothetical protein
VKKDKVVSFQSDEETRQRLGKIKKKKKKSKGENRVKDMELSMSLLAKCDAREDFPQFVEGTLPVEFRRKFTSPTEEVMKEMGEQIWMRGFADNRINHGATHAYTTTSSAGSEADEETQLPKPVEEKDTASRVDLQTQEESMVAPEAHADGNSGPKEPEQPKIGVSDPQQKNSPPEEEKKGRKRARPAAADESSDNTDTSRDAGKVILPGGQSQEQSQAVEAVVTEGLKGAAEKVSNVSTAEEVHVAPRKYGKTPKMLKTPRRSPTNLPLFTPPHARVLLKVAPSKEQHATRTALATRAYHATQKRPRAPKGKDPCTRARQVEQKPTAGKKSVPSESKGDDTPASPMKNLARVTKATLRAGKELDTVEHALEDKLTELAEKSAKAEEMRSKCAGLRKLPDRSLYAQSFRNRALTNTVACLSATRVYAATSTTSMITTSEAQQISRGDTSRINSSALARGSSEAKCGIRGLELALDDQLSRHRILDSAPTRTPPAHTISLRSGGLC